MMSTCAIPQDHPLLLHLGALYAGLARFQNDAHASAVKLQHHALASSHARENTLRLEHELSLLQSELDSLRSLSSSSSSTALPPDHPASLQIHQLSLSLRALSDKLDSTEHILLQRTHDLTATLSDLSKSKASTDAAYLLASRIRAREEASIVTQNNLELRLRIAEHKARMTEQAVAEYADLVRSLEATSGVSVSPPLQQQQQQQPPVVEISFAQERDELEARLAQVQHELAVVQAQLTAEIQAREDSNAELARLRFQLQKLERDDTTAAKMVSRYMKFSQNSTDALHATLDQLKTRHTATLNTLHYQLYILSSQLASSETTNTRLRHALDDLGGDMLRESYGRRREVALRIKLVYREEWILEALKRWLRRSEEALGKSQRGTTTIRDPVNRLDEMVQDAKIFIDALEDPIQVKEGDTARGGANVPVSGSLARLVMAQSVVDELVEEVQKERVRRVKAEERLVKLEEEAALASLPKMENEKRPLSKVSERQTAAKLEDLLGLDAEEPDESVDSLLLVQSAEEPAVLPVSAQALEEPAPLPLPAQLVKEPEALPSPTPPIEESIASSLAEESISTLPIEQPAALLPPTESIIESTIPASFTVPHDEEPSPPPPHPLLIELERARKRYEPLQRAFHDCHIALETLKSSLPDKPGSRTHIPYNILQAVLDRLDDFTEDVRVELEIRVSDEEVLGRGYEALLSVPGAVASSEDEDEDEDVPVKDQVEAQVRAFVEGTEPGIEKAKNGFEKKLEELQHDIAVLKRALYDPTMITHPDDIIADTGSSGGGGNEESEESSDETTSSPGWTSWISKSSSPAASTSLTVPAPTFGSVMTSRGWKRSASSSSSSLSLKAMAQDQDSTTGDLVEKLGLKIPMSSLALPGNHYHHLQPQWMLDIGNGQRPKRSVSAMYMLGMGSVGSSGSGRPAAGFSPVPMRRVASAAPRIGGGSEEDVD